MKSILKLEKSQNTPLPDEFLREDVRYPESLVKHFLTEFTKENDVVFDPFAGFGTTLLVAEKMRRKSIGIENDQLRFDYMQSVLKNPDSILHGDARMISALDLPLMDFCITSPPYMGKNDNENPLTAYSTDGDKYLQYLADIRMVYEQISEIMKPKSKAVIEISNLKYVGKVTTLAWDVAREVSDSLNFEGEIINDWDTYGYGYTHSYCLVFSKE
jgi:DNA modification methylase